MAILTQSKARPGWWAILTNFWAELDRDHVSIMAAGVAFYALLSIFPDVGADLALWPRLRSRHDRTPAELAFRRAAGGGPEAAVGSAARTRRSAARQAWSRPPRQLAACVVERDQRHRRADAGADRR